MSSAKKYFKNASAVAWPKTATTTNRNYSKNDSIEFNDFKTINTKINKKNLKFQATIP